MKLEAFMEMYFSSTDFQKVRRALFIGAHCDDTELRAGPVVRRLLRNGVECTKWTMIDGPWCAGVPGQDGRRNSLEMLSLRESENRKAAAILGIKNLHFFHLRASHLYGEEIDINHFVKIMPDFSSREELAKSIDNAVYTGQPMGIFAFGLPYFKDIFIKMVEDEAPDVIFTHSLNDLHIDHHAVCTMVLRTLQVSEKLRGTPVLMWRAGGNGGCDRYLPTHFIEVSNEDVELSDKAMQSYSSQFKPSVLQHGYVRGKCTTYGKLCGKEYAVAFTQQYHPTMNLHASPEDYILDEYRHNTKPEVISL
jgi:LmbE family N-acetylglucosaminyl deacetylase